MSLDEMDLMDFTKPLISTRYWELDFDAHSDDMEKPPRLCMLYVSSGKSDHHMHNPKPRMRLT
jgi:hypothetical protein